MKMQKPRGWDEMTKSEEKISDPRSSGNAATAKNNRVTRMTRKLVKAQESRYMQQFD